MGEAKILLFAFKILDDVGDKIKEARATYP